MASKRRYVFAEQNASKGGKFSIRLAVLSGAAFLACVIISFASGGKAGPFVGGIALAATLLSVYGFYVGMKSFGEQNVSPALSVIGSIASGVIMVGWITLFMTGLR